MRMLGVTSDESLKETANKARDAYQVMKESGTASTRELREGFRAYAEAAIKANNGVADGVLIGEAAVRGLRIETDNAGKSIISNMEAGAQATNGLTGSVQASTQAFQAQGAAARRTAEDIERMTAAKNGYAVASQAQADAANKALQAQYDRNKIEQKSILTPNNMQAVDNSGSFLMREKLRAGTLTEADIPLMETVASITRNNIKSFSMAGARSLEGMQDDIQWAAVAQQLEEKAKQLKQEKAIREAKQSLGITPQEETDKKKSAADLLYQNKFSLSAAEQEQLKKIPKFASGGYHSGGIRLVGENGPELEVTGPSRIINANKTRSLIKDAEANEEILRKAIESIEKKKSELDRAVRYKQSQATEYQKLSREQNTSAYDPYILKANNEANQLYRQWYDESLLLNEYKDKLKANAKTKREQELLLESAPPPAPRKVAKYVTESNGETRTVYEDEVAPEKVPTTTPTPTSSIVDANKLERERLDAHVKAIDAQNERIKADASVPKPSDAPAPVQRKVKAYRNDNGHQSIVYEDDPAPMTSAPLMQSAAAAQNANSSGGKTYTVNINLNGKTTTVNTSTDDDAQRLIDVLKSAKLAAGG